MSINSALLSGVSGLMANSSALATISDNIANVNTVGYKRNQTDFQTIVTARTYGSGSGGRGGQYNAGGVLAQTRQRVSEQGQLQRTSSATDLSVRGAGFFVTTERPENLTDADARLFTRAGSFNLDELGYLRNSAGLYLQGWPVDAEGNVAFDPSDLGRLETINVSQVGGAVEQTTRVSASANLSDAQPLSPDAAAYDPVSNNMAMYDPALGTGVRPDFELMIPVYDSKGGKHAFAISFLKAEDPADPTRPLANEWYAEVRAVPAEDVESAAGNGLIRTGRVVFTSTGQLDTAATTLFGAPYAPMLRIGASDGPAPTGTEVKWATRLGVSAQPIQVDIDSATGGLTQFNGRSFVRAVSTDGTAFGNLTNVEIDAEGFVTAVFDNGVLRRVAQVALATVPNPDGLTAQSGNSYVVSNDSGAFSLKIPGTGGSGLLSPSSLETSTVDLSTEFTGLITTQRAYSASSKIITTADEMLEELINIKR